MNFFFPSTDPTQVSCSSSTLSRFTRQLSTLLSAGIPLHEALETLTRIQADSLSIWITPELCKKITQGHRLSISLSHFPRVFPSTYVALVRASEETGKLVRVLERLADWLDRREKIERHVKKALSYPVMVVIVAGLLTIGLFKTVIPGILETVVGLGAELPLPTKILMALVSTVQQPVFWLFLAALCIAFVMYLRTNDGWDNFLVMSIHTPVLGPILIYSSSSRYTQTMAMLLDSGVDIIRACRIAADASGNPLVKRDAARVVKDIREGRYYSDTLSVSPLYPVLLADMIRVGDESGKLAVLLKKCGEMMEDDTVHKVDTFLNLLEPLVLASISLGVGFIVVSVLLPMSSLVSSL